jgi:hypothetical protein
MREYGHKSNPKSNVFITYKRTCGIYYYHYYHYHHHNYHHTLMEELIT